ncbi:MAG: Amuc_1100 family pilus-like protein [Verrucomicrobia subdivision 3 bacterium]|nr:Amuc_1100 family pilus-like protein [Limisphaerales bacterium]
MLWLRRNFWLGLGILLAVVLLGGGVYYFWTNRAKNKQLEAKLEEDKTTLTRLLSQDPFPSPTNITRAKEELARVTNLVNKAKIFFQPVPHENVAGEQFKALLDNILYELHRKAEQTSVALPTRTYAFTFAHQKQQLQFPPEAFPALPQQLAEIRTICDLLFEARVNRLITLRRARLYADEPVSQVDHHEKKPEVNEAVNMASNPYEITFHAFTPELAAALESFYRSTNGLIVKSIHVEVAPAPGLDPNAPPIGPGPGGFPGPRPPPPGSGFGPGPGRPPPPGAPPPRDAVLTVINERLLKIVLNVDVLRTIKPADKATQKQS